MIRSSENTSELHAALAVAQDTFPVVAKLHMAKIPTKTGGEYSYRYADLTDCVAAAGPILAANGLAVSQHPDWDGANDLLTSRLMHSSGQWQESSMRLFLSKDEPQTHGSALTYARRYAYCSIIGLVADVDDDGTAATHREAAELPRAGSHIQKMDDPYEAGRQRGNLAPAEAPKQPNADLDPMKRRIHAVSKLLGLNADDAISCALGADVAEDDLTFQQCRAVNDWLTNEKDRMP